MSAVAGADRNPTPPPPVSRAMLPLEWLRGLVPREIRERGDAYMNQGHVTSVRQEPHGRLVAVVRGERDYNVELLVHGKTVTIRCDCAYYADHADTCKHIWATLQIAAAKHLIPVDLSTISYGEPAGAIAAGRSAPSRAPRSTNPPAWRKFFDAVGPPPSGEALPVPQPLPDEIGYILQVPPGGITGSLSIVARSRKKNGEWRQWKQFVCEVARLGELPAFDRETLGLLAGAYARYTDPHVYFPASMAVWWVERLARAGRLFLRDSGDDLTPVTWDDGEPWHVRIAVRRDDTRAAYSVEGAVERSTGERLPLSEITSFVGDILVTGHRAVRFENPYAAGWLNALRGNDSVEIPLSDAPALREALLRTPLSGIALPEELGWELATIAPQPVLSLKKDGWSAEFVGNLEFLYNDWRVSSRSEQSQSTVGRRLIRRDVRGEQKYRTRLLELPVNSTWDRVSVRAPNVEQVVRTLTAEGWQLEIDASPIRFASDLDMEISSGIDWFDLHVEAVFGDQRIALPELLEAAARNEPFLRLADGSLGMLSHDWADAFATVAELGVKTGKVFRYQQHQALLLEAMLQSQKPRGDEQYERLRESISGRVPTPLAEPPTFTGALRPYQRAGLGWMEFLREMGLGGCLADDMGLGKTVQVLALLESLRASGTKGPSLVVAPRSLLFNWAAEAAKFAPQLRIVEHHGTDRIKETAHFEEHDLVLTTYATMRLDIAHFAETEFQYVILDEAQAIKNASSQVSKASRLLRGKHKLALSGTPIENHLGELWSLFAFLNPGLLGAVRTFNRLFGGKTAPPERREALARALRPLILRRTKEQVAPELPPRIEQTLYCELEDEQRKLYETLRESYRQSILGRVKNDGLSKSRMHILEALLRLRQVACHPALVPNGNGAPSAKLELLYQELDAVLASGHRALVFSQFTSLLAIVRASLSTRGIEHLYLDGATTDRESIVREFQSESGPGVFLISLKAGGLGLNLTQADYVFLLDPWWNPAVEAQAIDRAHRIGRERPVIAYRLIARDTVEEKILELQSRKRELADSIISEDNSVLRSLELADLELLLS
jgi:superfamily II DNA or RNA helicase